MADNKVEEVCPSSGQDQEEDPALTPASSAATDDALGPPIPTVTEAEKDGDLSEDDIRDEDYDGDASASASEDDDEDGCPAQEILESLMARATLQRLADASASLKKKKILKAFRAITLGAPKAKGAKSPEEARHALRRKLMDSSSSSTDDDDLGARRRPKKKKGSSIRMRSTSSALKK